MRQAEHSIGLPHFPIYRLIATSVEVLTVIPYQINQDSEVCLHIYGSDGTGIRQIDLGLKPAGKYQASDRAIYWDGRNNNGEQVSSGIYLYRLQAGDYNQIRKMVILK